jgi:hypothetical protein
MRSAGTSLINTPLQWGAAGHDTDATVSTVYLRREEAVETALGSPGTLHPTEVGC